MGTVSVDCYAVSFALLVLRIMPTLMWLRSHHLLGGLPMSAGCLWIRSLHVDSFAPLAGSFAPRVCWWRPGALQGGGLPTHGYVRPMKTRDG